MANYIEKNSNLSKLLKVIDYLRKEVDRELPLQQLHVLMAIAEHMKMYTEELADELDMQRGSLSRNIKMLSTYAELNDEGNLVERGKNLIKVDRDLMNRQKLVYSLTEKGENVLNGINRIMQDCQCNQI